MGIWFVSLEGARPAGCRRVLRFLTLSLGDAFVLAFPTLLRIRFLVGEVGVVRLRSMLLLLGHLVKIRIVRCDSRHFRREVLLVR